MNRLWVLVVVTCGLNCAAGSDRDDVIADHIVAALDPVAGDQAIIRFDPGPFPGLPAVLAAALEERGVAVDTIPYGEVDGFETRLAATDIYIWLPDPPPLGTSAAQRVALAEWLDAGGGRQIHFHWADGSRALDGLPGTHPVDGDSVFLAALDIDYGELDARQQAAINVLQSGEIHVTTPHGTDLRFSVGDRPFNRQNGDASSGRTDRAVTRIDREIELPAGVIRVAPVEQSVQGILVVREARFGSGNVVVRDLRISFVDGLIDSWSAEDGADAFRAALLAEPALNHFRELGIGFNPKLTYDPGAPTVPYYGYGDAIVRIGLGNNLEVGGSVGGIGVRWLFFEDATVTVAGAAVVRNGRVVVE